MLRYFNPLAWGRWIGQFFYGWVMSISWRDVPKAIPALILVFVLCVTGAIAWSDASDWRSRLLSSQLQAAWERDDYTTAELILKRQLARRPDDNRTLFNLAITLDAQGNRERALELTRYLVEQRNDSDSAQWLLAEEYNEKPWATLSAEQKDEFGRLLGLIYREKKNDTQTKILYADYLIAAERYAEAVPILSDLSRIQPMRGLQAAAIARTLGNHVEADLHARRCLDAVRKLSEEDPSNAGLALSVAQNQLFLKQYSEAIETVHRALPRVKNQQDEALLRQAIGDGIVAWIDHIETSPVQSRKERLRVLKLLELALKYSGNNPRVLALVADQVLATADEDDERIAATREALIEGVSPGVAHFIRGTAALIKEDREQAEMHLTLAAEIMPHSGAIMNNLAVAFSTAEDPDLQAALKCANSAIENTPEPAPHFYETRGQVLLRLDRHLEAVADLERAVSHPELAAKAHEALAVCYAELGQQELSRDHRAAAGLDPQSDQYKASVPAASPQD